MHLSGLPTVERAPHGCQDVCMVHVHSVYRLCTVWIGYGWLGNGSRTVYIPPSPLQIAIIN